MSHNQAEWGCVIAVDLDEIEMDTNKLQEMSAEELWTLHEEVASLLSSKIVAEKAKLDERHRKISGLSNLEQKRRSYPKVLPKYHNPKNPNETWSGRGKQPRWLTAQLGSGKKLTQFLIRRSA
jgi:DNA-binding protein H-NS